MPQEAIGELLKKLSEDPKVHLIYHPRGIGNGMPITEMLKICQEDLVMLLEDDGFIFESGEVSRCFQMIESDQTDIVGSPRGSCGQEIWEAAKVRWGLDYSGYGDVGPTWWPNFFFCKRTDLLRTDLNFASKAFEMGTYYKELDHTMIETQYGDTFVWASLQLRHLGLRSISVPQHKASPTEITDKVNAEQNWHPSQQPFKWIHGGSLSSGWGGYLSGRLPDVSTDGAKQEIESRCAFWRIALEEIEVTPAFEEEYMNGIDKLKEILDSNRIKQKKEIYRALLRL